MRLLKPETEIRNLKRQVRELAGLRLALLQERDGYRARATKAEQDAVEWKRRFDILLSRDRTEEKLAR